MKFDEMSSRKCCLLSALHDFITLPVRLSDMDNLDHVDSSNFLSRLTVKRSH